MFDSNNTSNNNHSKGKVVIVGAGPGALDLITVRGQNYLKTADTIIYTGSLVPENMLSVAKADAEIVDTRSQVLEDWLPLVAERAKAGKTVVRLQDGDPSLYGALHELTVYLLERDIPFEVVPGVSAFQGAAARLQVELTVPELVQTIILTRMQGQTNVPTDEDLSSLASHRASLCLYLSAHHCKQAQEKLLEHYPPDTPMALLYRVGWDDEYVKLASLDEMVALTHEQKLKRTVLYIISPALAGSPESRSRLYHEEHQHIFRPKK